MVTLASHEWPTDLKSAANLQRQLASQVIQKPLTNPPQIIAGADLAFKKNSNLAYACVVLLTFPELTLLKYFTLKGPVDFPYIPGYLSFREAPLLLNLFKRVKPEPDLVFFDGQGLAHPKKFGLASHMGVLLNRPSIGCAKSRLIGTFKEPGIEKGCKTQLMDKDGGVIGSVVRTRNNCKPLFISVGHLIDLDSSIDFVLKCSTRFKIPEPTRLAHNLVTAFKKEDRNVNPQ